MKFLSEESLKYYEKKKQNGEPVHILELSADELFAANPIPEKIFTDQELEENRKEAGESIKEVRKKAGISLRKQSRNPTRRMKRPCLNFWRRIHTVMSS